MDVKLRGWWHRRGRGAGSAVIVPVPEAEPALEGWGLPPTGLGTARGLPAHVTLLYPFVPPARLDDADLTALRRIVAATPAFRFALRDIGRFDGVLYLAPEPGAPFVALTRALIARWPQHLPYEGAHGDPVPHLTVVHGREPTSLAHLIHETLPLTAYASEAWLMIERGDGMWRTHTRCALGQSVGRPPCW